MEVVGAGYRDAEQMLDLREADDDRRGSGEADEDGVRQEVHDKSEPSEAEHEVGRSDEEGEQRRCRYVTGGALLVEGASADAVRSETMATGPTASWREVPRRA